MAWYIILAVYIVLIVRLMGRAPKDCTSCQLFELCEKNFKKTGITFCDTTIKPRRYYYESDLKSKK